MKLANSLFGRVVIALLLGIGIGMAAPDFGRSLQPLGDGFVKLIQMIIAPLLALTLTLPKVVLPKFT